jgi:Putative redox-active protein (C_GCAxxG_C_C)
MMALMAHAHTANEAQNQNLNQPEEIVEAPAKKRSKKRRVTKLRTLGTFLKRGACSTTLMTVLDRGNGHPMEIEERAADPLAGGLMQGYQCGMIWGSTLAAGAQAHRLHGPGSQAEAAAVNAAEKIVGSFRACHKHVDCLDITDTDPNNKWQTFKHFFLKGGAITCARRIARYAPQAHREINAALDQEQPQAGCNGASCAAKLARKMGASDEHATMAAGFAGGIGLSGGACGALGAAIWILGIQGRTAGDSQKVINERIAETLERFQKASQYEFECAEIVGRKFESLDDHADHVREGGCAAIIDALVGQEKLGQSEVNDDDLE